MVIPELNDEEIQDEYEMSEALSQELDSFCEELDKQPDMTRKSTQDDMDTDAGNMLWTNKACSLIENEISNLAQIGMKYFGEDADIEIVSNWCREI